MHCLWCMEENQTMLDWSNFLTLQKTVGLCANCEKKLQQLKGTRCKACSREMHSPDEICSDCTRWRQQSTADPLVRNYSIFQYNPFIKEIIAKWKYRGDYILGEIFKSYVSKHFLREFSEIAKHAVIIPIPLSDERLLERGFNQAKALASGLPLKQQEILIRIHGEKQSKKGRQERIRTENPFTLLETIQKPVVLVDDIYTTGTTLRHAAELLKKNGCPKVYAYTLVRG